MQLMTDVPLGAYLSGGLDSSLIVAVARAEAPEMATFTSVCAGSEDPWYAYVLSRAAGSRAARYVRFAPEDLLAELPRVAWAAEGAFDLAFVGRYQAAVRARGLGLKVLLSGQGIDELVGGYAPSYAALEASARRAACAARIIDDGWATIAAALRGSVIPRAIPDVVALLRREYAALSHYLLRFEDRMGMLAGVEVRVPYLDHRIVEICAGVTSSRRRRLFDDKYLVRQAARGLVPEGVRLRTKFAFNTQLPPITQVLSRAGRETLAAELLTDDVVRDKGYFDPRQVARLRAAGDYRALDAVLVVHLLDELFVSREGPLHPSLCAGAPIPTPEVTVDASWLPAESVLFARRGPSARDKPRLAAAVTHVGVLESVLPDAPGHLIAIQYNHGHHALIPAPDDVDADLVVAFLRRADGARTYADLAAAIGAGLEAVLSIGRFAGTRDRGTARWPTPPRAARRHSSGARGSPPAWARRRGSRRRRAGPRGRPGPGSRPAWTCRRRRGPGMRPGPGRPAPRRWRGARSDRARAGREAGSDRGRAAQASPAGSRRGGRRRPRRRRPRSRTRPIGGSGTRTRRVPGRAPRRSCAPPRRAQARGRRPGQARSGTRCRGSRLRREVRRAGGSRSPRKCRSAGMPPPS
jgi:hypothetical protein